VSGTIDYWVNQRGVPREKTLMGLASFGMSFDSEGLYLPFNNSVQDYYNVIQDLPGQGYTEHWDTISKVPYLTQDAGAWLWSYDNPRSMGIKCQYVLKNGLAGVAIWDVTGDYDDGRQILIDRIAAELNGKHDYLPVLLRRH
jgi:chitinase